MTAAGEIIAPTTSAHRDGPTRVVIVGAGFGGLAAAKALADSPHNSSGVQVTLLDRHNYHVFTPFLYQVATALLEPTGAAQPIRALIRGLSNVEFRLAEVSGVNFSLHQIESDRGPIGYDYLILAAGAVNDYFQNADIASHSFGLKDLGGAQELRNHILSCFEAANWATDPKERARQLTFVVVGGGPTGVEFSAALSVLVAQMAGRDFPAISNQESTIFLIEGSQAPLASYAPDLREKACDRLRARGVRIESAALVVDADEHGLVLKDGRRIAAATVVWAAGVRANPLAGCFPAAGSYGRVIVGPTLQVDRHPEVFAVGDTAEIPGRRGALPMLSPVAIQSGSHAARSVLALSRGERPTAFRYRDLGTMAVLGRGDAVAQIGRVHLSGIAGWLAWLGVHIARTSGLQVKATVVLSWVSGFVFADRPVRLITGPTLPRTSEPTFHQPNSEPATACIPPPPVRADLPSVNVANADRWGRVAALAWWSQDYPGRRPEPEEETAGEMRRKRRVRWRHRLFGDKASAEE